MIYRISPKGTESESKQVKMSDELKLGEILLANGLPSSKSYDHKRKRNADELFRRQI